LEAAGERTLRLLRAGDLDRPLTESAGFYRIYKRIGSFVFEWT